MRTKEPTSMMNNVHRLNALQTRGTEGLDLQGILLELAWIRGRT